MAPPSTGFSIRPVKGTEKVPRKDPFALGPGRKLRTQISKLKEDIADLAPEEVLRGRLAELTEIQAEAFKSAAAGAGYRKDSEVFQSYQERAVRLESERRHESLYRSHQQLLRRRVKVEQEAERAGQVRLRFEERAAKLWKELEEAGGPPPTGGGKGKENKKEGEKEEEEEEDFVGSSDSIAERRAEQRTLRRTREVLEVHLEELLKVKEEVLILCRVDVAEREKRKEEAWKDGPAIRRLEVPEGEKHGLVLPKAPLGSDPEAPMDRDGLLITDVAEGSPAEEFGVLGDPCTRWRLLQVNDVELLGKTEAQIQDELTKALALTGGYGLSFSEDPEVPPDPPKPPPGTGECIYRSLKMLQEAPPKVEGADEENGEAQEGAEGEEGQEGQAPGTSPTEPGT